MIDYTAQYRYRPWDRVGGRTFTEIWRYSDRQRWSETFKYNGYVINCQKKR